MPKSRTFTPPSSSTMMLAGFTSRWMIAILCAKPRPSHSSSSIFSLRDTGGCCSLRMISASVWPWMYSIAMNGWPSSSPTSKIVTMLGCRRRATDRASRVEALAKLLHVFAQQLDRDLPLEDRVPGEIQRAHAALSDAVDDPKATNSGRRLAHRRGSAATRRLTRGAEVGRSTPGAEMLPRREGRAGASRDRAPPPCECHAAEPETGFATMSWTQADQDPAELVHRPPRDTGAQRRVSPRVPRRRRRSASRGA